MAVRISAVGKGHFRTADELPRFTVIKHVLANHGIWSRNEYDSYGMSSYPTWLMWYESYPLSLPNEWADFVASRIYQFLV